jgi:hypothetical protein
VGGIKVTGYVTPAPAESGEPTATVAQRAAILKEHAGIQAQDNELLYDRAIFFDK